MYIADYVRSVWPRAAQWSYLTIMYVLCEYQKILAYIFLGKGFHYVATQYGLPSQVIMKLTAYQTTAMRLKVEETYGFTAHDSRMFEALCEYEFRGL